jgi:phospholipid-binding lipoprotein MlaA
MPTTRCRGTVFLVLALSCVSRAGQAAELGGTIGPVGASSPAPVGAVSAAGPEPTEAEPRVAQEPLQEPDPLFDDPEVEEEYEPPPPISDPLEPANRAFFVVNQQLDDWFWSPLTRAYRFVAPEPARRGIRRALRNLNTPIFFVNNLLQLRLLDAGETRGAFALNSTLGVLGLLEPSKEAGWEAHPADFGQTLDLVGIAAGPYLVLPVLGPTTVRDGFGSVVDHFFQPLNYVVPIVPVQLVWGGGAGLSLREEASDQLDALEKSSVDFYSVMRSAYAQSREREIAEARSRRDAQLAAIVPSAWRCGEPDAQTAQD